MAGLLIRRKLIHRKIHRGKKCKYMWRRRWPCGDGGRDWSGASAKELLRIPEAGRSQKGSAPENSGSMDMTVL